MTIMFSPAVKMLFPQQITEREQTRKIFLGGINPGTSEDFLKDFFKKYGEITDCCVIKTSGPEKKSRGLVLLLSPNPQWWTQ